MKEVIFPLEPRMQGLEVANLQAALQAFIDHKVLLSNDPPTRQEMSTLLQQEHASQQFGPATHKLVSIFQGERQLPTSGIVDEAAASTINNLLRDLGMLEQEDQPRSDLPRSFVVSGQVQRQDGLPLLGVQVRASHNGEQGAIRLGEDITDAEGRYTIRYEPLPEVDRTNLRVSAIGKDGNPLQSSDVISGANPLQVINLTVPFVAEGPTSNRRIEGRILLENGLPAEQLKLRLYSRDFGGETRLLSETTTLAGGQYAFVFDSNSKAVSIEVRVVKGENEEIPLSKPLNDLFTDESNTIVVNLVAPAALRPLPAEYRRLSTDVIQHIGQMTKLADAKENDERQDLTVLNRATGWDARLVALASTAERLSADADVKLPQEGLYGLMRAGLPHDKLMLAQVRADVVEQALKTVRDAGIVGLDDQQIGQFKQQFETFSNNVRLAVPAPGSRSTYGDLLKASGLNDDAQAKFASVYLSQDGGNATSTQLWESVRKAGLDEAQINKLQLQGKMAFLAGNSQLMITRLMDKQITEPAELVEQDFHKPDQWKAEIMALAGNDEQKLNALIPDAYSGEKVQDRLNAYAEDMARKVRLSYPTQVIGRMIDQDSADQFRLGAAAPALPRFSKNAAAQGFRLGQTPVESFFKTHTGVTADMTNEEITNTKQQIKTLQRVYQITPDNESMSLMVDLGLTSAYDVVAVSQEVFLDLYGPKFSKLEQARMVYRKAKQVSSITYNLFTIAKKMVSEPLIHGISAPAEKREAVKDELIKHYPTMSSLFGSMDFCECEHCRSVLSPAAYLVDLLQFIDIEPEVWGNFLGKWKDTHNNQEYSAKYAKPYDAFIERRPDLPHIQLTCENTQTALPYIDVVNEILEYYVANGKLEQEAARDTGEATTAELLAEPQNVMREAYDKLRETHYPLNLPFDLWIETVRQFCDYFETPLAHLLEVFRSSDNLFGPTQRTYDRSSIFIESLGLSPAEGAIFIDPDSLAKWHELYGFNTVDEATIVAEDAETGERTDLNSAKALSRRLGVTYKDLVEIVKTNFVNPKLEKLGLAHKLGVSIHDVRTYLDHKPLFVRDPTTLSESEKEERLEVEAFEHKLASLANKFKVPLAQLEAQLQTIPFDDILVLADPDTGCNFDLTTLRYASGKAADDIAFLKINLFVRLSRKLGWTIEEIDRGLQAFVPKNTPFERASLTKQPLKTTLIYFSHLKTLDQKVQGGKQSRLKLTTLWSDIATNGNNPLYAQLFLTRSMLKSDDVFDNPLGQYLSAEWIAKIARERKYSVQLENVAPADKIDPALFAANTKVELSYDTLQEVQYLAFEGVLTDAEKATLKALSTSPVLHKMLDAVQAKGQEFALLKGHLLALQGALGLTADEIRRILNDAGKSLDTAELSLPHVSLLFRYALLANALKLSVQELIVLKQLSGIDPFKLLHPDPLPNLNEDYPFSLTLRFVEMAEQVKESGLKIEDIEYLLRHRFDETGKYRPNRESTLVLLKMLSEGIRAIRTEHAVPDDPASMSEEVLRQQLGLALPPDVVERFFAFMNGTVEFTATKSGVAPGNKLQPKDFAGESAISEVHYNEALQEQRLSFRGVLLDAERNALMERLPKPVPPNPHVPSPVLAALLADVQQQARSFFEKYLQRHAPNVQPAGGFLDAADFDLLFDKKRLDLNRPLAEGETEESRIRNQQATIRSRQAKLVNAFQPFLQQRLIRQFIVQTLTAHTAADPVLVESLLTDLRLLAVAKPEGETRPLLEILAAAAESGTTATFFASADGTGQPLKTAFLADGNTGLKDRDGNPIKPAEANSARLEGYLEVPTAGAYRFYVALDKKNAEAELRFAHLTKPTVADLAKNPGDHVGNGPDEYAELKAGVPYRFTLDLRKLNGGEAQLLVQGETLPKDTVARLALYPATTMEAAERALGLLTKALRLLQSLFISEREARYLLTHASNFDGLNLSNLPTQETDETPASGIAATQRFAQLLRLASYALLKRDLAGGTDDLIAIFEANETADLDNKVYPLIAKLTRRDETTVKSTAKALFASPAFASEKPLQRLWEALRVVERFAVPVSSLLGWTNIIGAKAPNPMQRFDIAFDLKEAIKARFEPETWQRVAQPIFDKLRQRKRDSLVAHVMHQHGFSRMEQLYEYFLLDPGMEPVVQTSRIRLAIASVQLFVQRSLLNLEPKVHPSAIINAKQWEWMKRYRVWEANRKIFLFPENWLEPEFRDDKTHLFSELEGTLLQGDVSDDLVEDAFLNYLKKLDELARLDIVAMHLEDKPDPAQNILHVIGRTYSEPHKYFYRRYAHYMWTSWEPVSAEIEGDHLAPIIWHERLYLFWVTFMESPADQEPPTGPASGTKLQEITLSQMVNELKSTVSEKQVDVQLHWSEYFHGEWTTRESGRFASTISKTVHKPFNPLSVFIHVSKGYDEDGEESGVFIHLGSPFYNAFYLAGRNSAPKKTGDYFANWQRGGIRPTNPYGNMSRALELATRYSYTGALYVSFTQRISTEPGKEPELETLPILQQGNREYTLLPCDNNIALGGPDPKSLDADDPAAVKAAIESGLPEIASLMKPLFYQDEAHTLFIQPNVNERTIEEWQEWITRTPQAEPGRLKPDQFKAIPVMADIPRYMIIDDHGDTSSHFTISANSIANVKPSQDWLVNPSTGLLFEDKLVGPAGAVKMQIRPSTELASGITAGGMSLNVNPSNGGGLATNDVAVLDAPDSLENTGLLQPAGGLNVVGSSGNHSALTNNTFRASNRPAFGRARVVAEGGGGGR